MFGAQLSAIVTFIFAVHAAHAAAPQRDFPFVPAPEGASNYWVAPYLEQNTVPMQIRGFESTATMADTVKFYEKWFADKRGYNVESVGPAKVLGAKLGNYQVTVQIRPSAKGTVGTLTAAAVYEVRGTPEELAAQIGQGLPKPAGSEVFSDTISYDPGTRNRTIIVKNTVSVETNSLYMREEMIKLGWTLNEARTLEGGKSSMLAFRKAREEMIVTVAKHDADVWIISSQTAPD